MHGLNRRLRRHVTTSGPVTMKPYPTNTNPAEYVKTHSTVRFASVMVALLLVCLMFAVAHAAESQSAIRISGNHNRGWRDAHGSQEGSVPRITQRPGGFLVLSTFPDMFSFGRQRFHNLATEVDGLINNEAINTLVNGRGKNLWTCMLIDSLSQGCTGAHAIYGAARGFAATFFTNAFEVNHDEQPPPVYQTWYFYLILAVLATAAAVFSFRRHLQLMKGRLGIVLEERNRIACEYHDTLMAGFAAISWQLEATAKLFGDSGSQPHATAAAESFELARSMVSHCQAEARRIIWDLRATDEVTNVLSQALYRTLGASRMHGTIETTLDVEGDEVALAPGCVHHLLCIGQEAISNALRHAQPAHIIVHLKYEGDSLQLSIRDDGRGFCPTDSLTSRGHFGIPVMEERARKLGGTLHIETSIGVGTSVTVKVSFNALQLPVNQEHHVIRWIGI
jgi:signal transduction histidine kinase